MAESPPPTLAAREISTGYGKREVLKSVSITVTSGQIIAVIGRNGSGKSTLLRAVFGLLPIWAGSVYVAGKLVTDVTPHAMLLRGVGLVLQGSRVFSRLTVSDNLLLAADDATVPLTPSDAIRGATRLFPELRQQMTRLAGSLSGGEKQALSLASALVRRPSLLLLDEPSLGLSPQATSRVFEHIAALNQEFGTTILLVEQKVGKALRLAQSAYVLRNGEVAFSGATTELLDKSRLVQALM